MLGGDPVSTVTSTLLVTYDAIVDVDFRASCYLWAVVHIDGIENCAVQMETVLHCSAHVSKLVRDKVDRCTPELHGEREDMYSQSVAKTMIRSTPRHSKFVPRTKRIPQNCGSRRNQVLRVLWHWKIHAERPSMTDPSCIKWLMPESPRTQILPS